MTGPELALAASARDWPDLVHRFLLDHGGGRVRARVMGAEQALAAEYEVLVIDDVCSFLSPRLVRRLREQGREVLGVFSPEDGPDAKRRLLECGIADVIEADARPEEFLASIAATLSHRSAAPRAETTPHSALRIAVSSAATGVGGTEVAIALAAFLAETRDVIVVDLDQAHPGIAQRLDLPPHPNLRTAVDLAHYDQERLTQAVVKKGALNVVGGVSGSTPDDGEVPQGELEGLLEDLGRIHPTLVLDLGEPTVRRPPKASSQLMVGEASPVGLTRLVQAVTRIASSDPHDLVAVVNRVAGGAHRRDDIRAELARAIPGIPTVLLPQDRRIELAAWNGELTQKGPFAGAVRRIARLIDEMAP